jgi:exosortase
VGLSAIFEIQDSWPALPASAQKIAKPFMWKYVFWVVLLALPAPFLAIEWTRMWQHDHYLYLPVLFVVMATLFSMRWDRNLKMPVGRASQLLLASGVVSLLVAALRFSPWLGAFGWVLLLGGFLNSQSGTTGSRDAIPIWMFLYTGGKRSVAYLWPLSWLALPLPRNLDLWLVAKSDLLALRMSSFVLDLLGIPHRMLADVVELRADQIPVEALFAGVQSTFALVFLAVLIVVILGRSPWLVPIYIAAAIFWSVFMNVLRVVPAVTVQTWYAWDWTIGWAHATLNVVTLSAAILCLLSSDRLFKVVFFPTKPDELSANPNPIVSLWNRMFLPYASQAASKSRPALQQ